MKIKNSIINLLKKLGKIHAPRKKAPPESLSPEAMEKVMAEVNFLRNEHAVNVRNLEKGEMPTIPKRADL